MGPEGSRWTTGAAQGDSEASLRSGKPFIRQQSRLEDTLLYGESPTNETSFFDLVIGPFLLALIVSFSFLLLCTFLSEHGIFLPVDETTPPLARDSLPEL